MGKGEGEGEGERERKREGEGRVGKEKREGRRGNISCWWDLGSGISIFGTSLRNEISQVFFFLDCGPTTCFSSLPRLWFVFVLVFYSYLQFSFFPLASMAGCVRGFKWPAWPSSWGGYETSDTASKES